MSEGKVFPDPSKSFIIPALKRFGKIDELGSLVVVMLDDEYDGNRFQQEE
jgi:hypothetical protein